MAVYLNATLKRYSLLFVWPGRLQPSAERGYTSRCLHHKAAFYSISSTFSSVENNRLFLKAPLVICKHLFGTLWLTQWVWQLDYNTGTWNGTSNNCWGQGWSRTLTIWSTRWEFFKQLPWGLYHQHHGRWCFRLTFLSFTFHLMFVELMTVIHVHCVKFSDFHRAVCAPECLWFGCSFTLL